MWHEGLGGPRPAGWLRSAGWLRPRSLRIRLVAAAVCLLAAGAAAMAGAYAVVVRGYLIAQADSRLRAYAEQLTGHPFVATPWSGPAPADLAGGGPAAAVSIEVRGAAGQLVMRQGQGGQAIPVVSAGVVAQAGQLATIADGGGSWRVIAEPVHYRARRLPYTYSAGDVAVLVTSRAQPGLDGTLVAGLDLGSADAASGTPVVTILAVSGVVILAAGCLGAVVIRAILRPVRMAEQALAAAAAGDPASRASAGRTGSLACSVNTMLGQIEQAFRIRTESEAAARESAEQLRRAIVGTGYRLRRPLSIIDGAAAWYRHRGQPSTGELDRMMRQVAAEAARLEALTDELRTGPDQPPPPQRG